jgi:hypothetical protein
MQLAADGWRLEAGGRGFIDVCAAVRQRPPEKLWLEAEKLQCAAAARAGTGCELL